MKSIAAFALVVGCSHGSGVSDEYRADITNLCDAVKLSGAADIHDDSRITVIAMWLGSNIRTKEGKEFLVSIQPLKGDAKAQRLDDEAKRVGLLSCPLSTEWRK